MSAPPPFNPGPPRPGVYGGGPTPPPFPPPGPPKGGSTAGIVIAGGMVGLILIAVVAAAVVWTGDGGDRKRRRLAGGGIVTPTIDVPRPPTLAVTPTPEPTDTGPREVEVGATFFSSSVQTARGTYRASSRWTRSCTAEAKPRLRSLLRGTPCEGSLRGAMYQSPDKRVYVQMTAMKFESEADARKVARAVKADVAPKIRVAYGNEPGHWWSSSSYGKHVLIRQSFVNESRSPGSRSGPAQTYGDTLIRKFHAVLSNLYVLAD